MIQQGKTVIHHHLPSCNVNQDISEEICVTFFQPLNKYQKQEVVVVCTLQLSGPAVSITHASTFVGSSKRPQIEVLWKEHFQSNKSIHGTKKMHTAYITSK